MNVEQHLANRRAPPYLAEAGAAAKRAEPQPRDAEAEARSVAAAWGWPISISLFSLAFWPFLVKSQTKGQSEVHTSTFHSGLLAIVGEKASPRHIDHHRATFPNRILTQLGQKAT